MSTWDTNEFIRKNGGIDDMYASVYLADSLGGVYRESIDNYTDFEYYNRPYEKNE